VIFKKSRSKFAPNEANKVSIFIPFSIASHQRYKSLRGSHDVPYCIRLFKFITMLCGIDIISHNVPHIEIECEEYMKIFRGILLVP
jgi:hypothetical protein